MSQAEIKEIYKKVQIQRQQITEKTQKAKEDTMEAHLTRIFGKYFALLQDPKISAGIQDEAKRDISKFLDSIMMNSDHDVIMALTNMELTKKYKEKQMLILKNGTMIEVDENSTLRGIEK